MANDDIEVAAPAQAVAPRGVNHLVLNVLDIEVSHRFWTEMMGFRQVGALKPRLGEAPRKMRFYSGVRADGDLSHHDLALCELPASATAADGAAREAAPSPVGLNHVAISWPDRPSWLQQLAFLQSKGVSFQRRINHGMSHSAYIADPDGHGIEVLYELPREVWAGDIDGALNYAERLPTEGEVALVDRTDNPVFGAARA